MEQGTGCRGRAEGSGLVSFNALKKGDLPEISDSAQSPPLTGIKEDHFLPSVCYRAAEHPEPVNTAESFRCLTIPL